MKGKPVCLFQNRDIISTHWAEVPNKSHKLFDWDNSTFCSAQKFFSQIKSGSSNKHPLTGFGFAISLDKSCGKNKLYVWFVNVGSSVSSSFTNLRSMLSRSGWRTSFPLSICFSLSMLSFIYHKQASISVTHPQLLFDWVRFFIRHTQGFLPSRLLWF